MQKFTQVPNQIFDEYLSQLTFSELKVLLIVIRQTLGWVNKKTGKRKSVARITHNHFILKTGISRKTLSQAIQSLVAKGFIRISGYDGVILNTPDKRKGKTYLKYEFTFSSLIDLKLHACEVRPIRPAQFEPHIKIKKIKETELERKRVGEILRKMYGELFND